MEKTIEGAIKGMSREDLMEKQIDRRVNERFAQMKAEVNETLASWRQCESAAQVDGEPFYRLQSYISTLVQVQGSGHKVNIELDEAIAKLKELAYT